MLDLAPDSTHCMAITWREFVRFAAGGAGGAYQKQPNRCAPMAVVWLPTRGLRIAAMPRKAKGGKLNIELIALLHVEDLTTHKLLVV